MYQADNCIIGGGCITASFEDAGISTAETEREYIESHIGTRFIDHAYDTEGDANATQLQSVG